MTNTLQLVGVRDGEFVTLSGAIFDSEEEARSAFDSVPEDDDGPVVLDLCTDDGDIIEDKGVSIEAVKAILAKVDPRPFADILNSAPLYDER